MLVVLLLKDELVAAFEVRKGAVDERASIDKAVV